MLQFIELKVRCNRFIMKSDKGTSKRITIQSTKCKQKTIGVMTAF